MPFSSIYNSVRLKPLNLACKLLPRGYKTLFMLNSTEHEILNAHKYKNIKKFTATFFFWGGGGGSDKPGMLLFFRS